MASGATLAWVLAMPPRLHLRHAALPARRARDAPGTARFGRHDRCTEAAIDWPCRRGQYSCEAGLRVGEAPGLRGARVVTMMTMGGSVPMMAGLMRVSMPPCAVGGLAEAGEVIANIASEHKPARENEATGETEQPT